MNLLESNAMFNGIGHLLKDAFEFGRNEFGYKICLGTEAPLAIPSSVQGTGEHGL